MTRLILVRHGETNWNREGRFCGRSDVPQLTEKGKEQAIQLKERLKDADTVYSSPLQRAVDTARLLFPKKDIIVRDDLIERDFGALDGRLGEEVKREQPKLYEKYWIVNEFPGVKMESFQALADRGLKMLKEIAEIEDGTAVVVWHGTIMRAVLSRLTGLDSRDGRVILKNCSKTVLEVKNGEFVVKVLNDVAFGVKA